MLTHPSSEAEHRPPIVLKPPGGRGVPVVFNCSGQWAVYVWSHGGA